MGFLVYIFTVGIIILSHSPGLYTPYTERTPKFSATVNLLPHSRKHVNSTRESFDANFVFTCTM